jgi:hypothetical protein
MIRLSGWLSVPDGVAVFSIQYCYVTGEAWQAASKKYDVTVRLVLRRAEL